MASNNEGVLFVPYADTVDLLSVKEALRIVEDVYRMQGEGSVMASSPPSFKLDVGEPFHNHWHVMVIVPAGLLRVEPVEVDIDLFRAAISIDQFDLLAAPAFHGVCGHVRQMHEPKFRHRDFLG